MGLVSHTISGLYGGISQQPYNTRLDNQSENQINTMSNLVNGVFKRPPTEFINNIFNTNTDYKDGFFHTIIKGDNKYFIMANDTEFRAFNEKGKELTVQFDNSTTENYCKNSSKKKHFSLRASKIEDTTFIVNNEVNIESEETTEQPNINFSPYYLIVNVSTVSEVAPGGNPIYLHWEEWVDIAGYNWYFKLFGGEDWKPLPTTDDRVNTLVNLINNTSSRGLIATKINSTSFRVERKDGKEVTGVGSARVKYQQFKYIRNLTHNDYSGVSGGGTTIVTNKQNKGFAYVKNGSPDSTYTVVLQKEGGTKQPFIVNTTSTPTSYRTDDIAFNLAQTINASSDFDAEVTGNVVLITSNDDTNFTIESSDSKGDNDLLSFKDEVQKFEDLPTNFFAGVIIKIKDVDSEYGYYMLYNNNVWTEWRRKNINHNIKNSTMPKEISIRYDGAYIDTINNPKGDFVYISEIIWKDREVGDEDTAPFPSFVNNKIENLLLFKGRLGFLTGRNLVLSKADDYTNFFPNTAKEVLDDDPIDLNIVTENSGELKNAAIYNNNLLLFTDRSQLVLSTGNKPLTPDNIVINPSTNYEVDNNVKPITVGPNVYFVNKKIEFSGIREYFLLDNSITNTANDISLQIPNYLPNDLRKITASSSFNILAFLSKTDNKTIFVYNYFWNGNQKIQSAWNKFELSNEILYIEIIDSILYILVKNSNNDITLERINLEIKNIYNKIDINLIANSKINTIGYYDSGTNTSNFAIPEEFDYTLGYTVTDNTTGNDITNLINDTYTADRVLVLDGEYYEITLTNIFIGNENQLSFNVHLDKRVEATGSYDSLINKTTFTLPYNIDTNLEYSIIDKNTGFDITTKEYDITNNVITLNEEWSDIIFGYNYNMLYEFSTFVIRDQNGVADVEGKLQMKNITISYNNTGMFDLNIKPTGREVRVNTYTGVELGSNNIGSITTNSDSFHSLLMGNNKNLRVYLTNKTYLPSQFQTVSWEANFVKRSQTI